MTILTLKRARGYATIIALITLLACANIFRKESDYFTTRTDFPVFYNVGRILNEHGRSRLYDAALQADLFREAVPKRPKAMYFAYAPFFALLFVPLAMLPYPVAFTVWLVFSLLLFILGFQMVWRVSGLPVEHRTDALMIGLCTLPFFAWCLLAGQTSAVGFFAFSLAIYLDHKNRPFASGAVLALLLYKPPLLLFVVPMLIASRRWRTLCGLAVSGAALALLSLAIVGFNGLPAYLGMLNRFSHMSADYRNFREIDLFTSLFPLIGRRAAYLCLIAICAIVVSALWKRWRADNREAWIHVLIWTVVLNVYVVIYDSTILIIAAVLSASSLRQPLPISFRWLLVALFLAPFIQTDLASQTGISAMTIAIVLFGISTFVMRAPHTTEAKMTVGFGADRLLSER